MSQESVYRRSPRPMAAPPPAPIHRLAWAWIRGVFRRLEEREHDLHARGCARRMRAEGTCSCSHDFILARMDRIIDRARIRAGWRT